MTATQTATRRTSTLDYSVPTMVAVGHQHWPPLRRSPRYDPRRLPTDRVLTTFQFGGALSTYAHLPGIIYPLQPLWAINTEYHQTHRESASWSNGRLQNKVSSPSDERGSSVVLSSVRGSSVVLIWHEDALRTMLIWHEDALRTMGVGGNMAHRRHNAVCIDSKLRVMTQPIPITETAAIGRRARDMPASTPAAGGRLARSAGATAAAAEPKAVENFLTEVVLKVPFSVHIGRPILRVEWGSRLFRLWLKFAGQSNRA